MLSYQRTLLIHDKGLSTIADQCYELATRSMNQARLDFDEVQFAAYPWPELQGYSSVVLSLGQGVLLSRGQSARINSFVESGGGLILYQPYWDYYLASLIGTEKLAESPRWIEDTESIEFVYEFVPGIQGLTIPISDIRLELSPKNVTIVAQSASGEPVAWINKHKRGRVIVFNSSLFRQLNACGLLVEAILRAQPIAIRPLANIGLIHIDDFPAPLDSSKREPVYSEYGMSMVEFYHQVWLPDLLALAKRFGIEYTFLIAFNYNHKIRAPFTFEEWESVALADSDIPFPLLAARLVSKEHELGLHGYNHQSFTLDQWKDKEQMQLALKAVLDLWQKEDLGGLPQTFVPPNNQYDQSTIDVLIAECPSLTSICGSYFELMHNGKVRDIGPEPWGEQLLCLPRNTSGYQIDKEFNALSMLSMLSAMGAWHHFFHPDDISDIPLASAASTTDYYRNQDVKGWKNKDPNNQMATGLYDELVEWFEFTKKHYPWFRYTSTKKAVPIMKSYLNSRPTTRFTSKGLHLSNGQNLAHGQDGYYEIVVENTTGLSLLTNETVEIVSIVKSANQTRYVVSTLAANIEFEFS